MPLSFQEFRAWEPHQQGRHEFLAGEVVAMTGTSDRHNTVSLNLAFALRERLRDGPCQVFMADVMVRVEAADAAFYPDVFVTCAEADRADPYVKREPSVVIEDKFDAYRRLPSLQEYILVDPERPRVEVFRRNPGGQWLVDTLGAGGTLRLGAPALEIPMTEIYRD